MVNETAVKAISELAQQAQAAAEKTVTIEERVFSTVPLHEIPPERLPEPAVLVVHTLTGLRDYIAANRDELNLDECILHVVGPDRVDLVSRIRGESQQRFVHVSARVPDRLRSAGGLFQFGQYYAAEDMVIALQTLFEEAGDVAAVRKYLGNLRDEAVKTLVDDGTSQSAAVRVGVAGVAEQKVPNPVSLAPFRTFPEVAQPASRFVLRLKKGREGIEAALFEADGGAWRAAAIEGVALWLRDWSRDVSVIA